jgi:mono/diheme cytochrome c family protein
MFEKRAQIPVESRQYVHFYLAFSGILFLATAWSIYDEVRVRRPWKEYQEQYRDLAAQTFDSLRTTAIAEIDSTHSNQLKDAIAAAEQGLHSRDYLEAFEAKQELAKLLDVAIREWRFARSRSDAAYYTYKKALNSGEKAVQEKNLLDEHDANIAKHFSEKNDLEAKIAKLDETINRYTDAITKARVEYNALWAKATAYEAKREKANAAPSMIRQVVLNDFEVTPFQEIKARVDRCQTCHSGWNEEIMAEAPEPFRKHPLPELLAKHNPESFGCTPCHRGQGPALTAGFAHGDADHYWETPLLRGKDVYASCNSCHTQELSLKYAKPFNKAKQVIFESGCYGCHEIKGYTELAKIGPQLSSLAAKTTPGWVFRWVKDPKEYNPHTRMPNFRFADEQAEAITAYLFNVGKQSPFIPATNKNSYAGGDARNGKQVFESVGCQACHVAGDFSTVRDARGTSYDIAPELTRVGSKVNPDWMFDWIKNPRHYNPETRMPNLRLTDSEAKDVVAFLMTMKDQRQFAAANLDLDDPAKIAKGNKLIREFGCAGCHAIKGMENEGKVSVELSDFGRKKVEQMDFGDIAELSHHDSVDYLQLGNGKIAVKHEWRGWVFGKLKNSRLYQTERIIQKMPVFNFNAEEIGLVRMFLLSLTKDVPVVKYQHAYDKRQQDIEAGRRTIYRYSCFQCHQVEEGGGYLLAKYEEAAQGPPILPESQGAKVQEPWLFKFLSNPSTIRPWLKVRMPTFSLSENEISSVQKYFLGMSKQDLMIRDYASTSIDKTYLAAGKKLFDAYQCAKCHPAGNVNVVVSSTLAPNLAMASTRLKPEWIAQWLNDPQKLQPGTMMPLFFNEGKGPDETIFEGKQSEQVKALQTYVWSLGGRKSGLQGSTQ